MVYVDIVPVRLDEKGGLEAVGMLTTTESTAHSPPDASSFMRRFAMHSRDISIKTSAPWLSPASPPFSRRSRWANTSPCPAKGGMTLASTRFLSPTSWLCKAIATRATIRLSSHGSRQGKPARASFKPSLRRLTPHCSAEPSPRWAATLRTSGAIARNALPRCDRAAFSSGESSALETE